MAERKLDIDLRTTSSLHTDLNPTKEERELFRQRVASVGSRGIISARLDVELPPELHGEWVERMNVGRIHEYETMGFKVDDTYAKDKALHSDGTDAPIIGDVVFMTIPKWKKELHQEEFSKKMERNNPTRNPENDMLARSLANDGVENLRVNNKDVVGSSESVLGLENIQALKQSSE